jgi:LacI family transcriptional regulator
MTPERLASVLRARDIRGVIVFGPFEGGRLPAGMKAVWEGSAAVVVGVRPARPPLAFVSNDQFLAVVEAVRRVRKLGYRRPGLCVHPAIDAWVENRFTGGYHAAVRSVAGCEEIPVFAYRAEAEEANVRRRFLGWVEERRPDVILTEHADVAGWLEEMGWEVPGAIGLVHLDLAPGMAWAGIRQNNPVIGRAAVEMLIAHLHRNEFGVPSFQKSMFIGGDWVAGATLASRRPRGRQAGS